MKRIKLILIGSAIVVAVASSFATTKYQTCQYYPQYRFINNTYQPAGQEGTDYLCWDIAGYCTYYKPGIASPYIPCKTGAYIPLH